MNWDAIGATGELIGAAVVLVTLVYLAQQIRQNTKALSASAIDSVTNHGFQELRWWDELAEIVLKAEKDPASLSELEVRRVRYCTIASIRNRQNEYFQYIKGALDQDVWDASERLIAGILLTNSISKEWFDSEAAKSVLAKDFYSLVQQKVVEYQQEFDQILGESPTSK